MLHTAQTLCRRIWALLCCGLGWLLGTLSNEPTNNCRASPNISGLPPRADVTPNARSAPRAHGTGAAHNNVVDTQPPRLARPCTCEKWHKIPPKPILPQPSSVGGSEKKMFSVLPPFTETQFSEKLDPTPAPLVPPECLDVRLSNVADIATLLQEELRRADEFEEAGSQSNDPNNLLTQGCIESLWDAASESWLGISGQYVKDAQRQSVMVETISRSGKIKQAPLGSLQIKSRLNSAPSLSPIDAQASHLLQLCDGDLRWRFQATQLLNQTLPNAVASVLQRKQALIIGNTVQRMLGTSHETCFLIRRRSHQKLLIVHTSVWRPRSNEDFPEDPPRLPFYVDKEGRANLFAGRVEQMVCVGLNKPRAKDTKPRIRDIKVTLKGEIEPR